jgi:hypothetical protein
VWRPPERIRHDARPGRWPTRDEALRSRLFGPIRVGALVLAHRTWVPAMVPWRATEDGYVTDDVLDWYGRFARGQPAAIVVEATRICDLPSGPLLRIGDDRFVPGLKRLVETVRSATRTSLTFARCRMCFRNCLRMRHAVLVRRASTGSSYIVPMPTQWLPFSLH